MKAKSNRLAIDIIRAFQDGKMDEPAALRRLDAVQVNGAFDELGRFTGYDRGRHQWIESAYGVTVES